MFNLIDDPKELKNISSVFDEKKQTLLNKLNKLKNETNAKEVSINPNFKN